MRKEGGEGVGWTVCSKGNILREINKNWFGSSNVEWEDKGFIFFFEVCGRKKSK